MIRLLALILLLSASGTEARAAGSMDPTFQEVVGEPKRAVGRVVDWTVQLDRVDKHFYTYTMTASFIPSKGEEPCKDCKLAVIWRGRPEESPRPARFKAGQVVIVRGSIIKLGPPRALGEWGRGKNRPQVTVLAFALSLP